MSTHSAPVCYGRQWSEQDQECHHCRWAQSCKPEFLSANGIAARPATPSPWPYPTTPPTQTPQTPQTPQPTVAVLPVIQTPAAQPAPNAPNAPSAVKAASQLAQQPVPIQTSLAQPVLQALQGILPQQFNPYFQQRYQPYAGESTAGRVVADILLKMGVTLFSELAQFCGVWRPEPPSSDI